MASPAYGRRALLTADLQNQGGCHGCVPSPCEHTLFPGSCKLGNGLQCLGDGGWQVLQGLAKSIVSDGEGATCLIEAAISGRDPSLGRVACAAGYAGVEFNQSNLQICLGPILLMKYGQPVTLDRAAASMYLRTAGDFHGTALISIVIGGSRCSK